MSAVVKVGEWFVIDASGYSVVRINDCHEIVRAIGYGTLNTACAKADELNEPPKLTWSADMAGRLVGSRNPSRTEAEDAVRLLNRGST